MRAWDADWSWSARRPGAARLSCWPSGSGAAGIGWPGWLRARGQLTELRAAELRFTPGDAAVLLQQVAAAPGAAQVDAPLPDAVAAALAARTEGWAAGLQLAGLSLRGHNDVDGFVAAFTCSHRHILDYLAEEVLERQPGRGA
jgi:LuxR family maltose regulon positive regulatory protein